MIQRAGDQLRPQNVTEKKTMSRIELDDTVQDIVMKMSNMNPGAISVLINICRETSRIDPDNAMGEFGVMMFLDTLGIYGSDIYFLYADFCKRDTEKMLAVLRAVQLGFFCGNTLADAASRRDMSGLAMVPVDELCRRVKDRLPNFVITASTGPAPGAGQEGGEKGGAR